MKYEILFYKHVRDKNDNPIISPEGFVQSLYGKYSDIYKRDLVADDFVITGESGDHFLLVETAFLVYLETDADPSHYSTLR